MSTLWGNALLLFCCGHDIRFFIKLFWPGEVVSLFSSAGVTSYPFPLDVDGKIAQAEFNRRFQVIICAASPCGSESVVGAVLHPLECCSTIAVDSTIEPVLRDKNVVEGHDQPKVRKGRKYPA